MAKREERKLLVGLDIGTSKVACIVAEANDGQLEIIGLGSAPSKGMKKGMVVNIESTTDSIRRAVEEFDLKVLGEVGKKEGLNKGIPLVEDTLACLEAGSSIVLLEAAELIGDDADTAREVEDVVRAVGLEKIMFELPGPWIAGVSAHDIHRMRRQLVERYGSQVNLGNIFPEDLISLEAYRRGLGVNAGHEE